MPVRVPACAVAIVLVACAACGDAAGEHAGPQPSAAVGCKRGGLAGDLDPASVSWTLVPPPSAADNLRMQTDAVVDLCDDIITLAHPAGPRGGKSIPMGPSVLFSSADAATWKSFEINVDGAVFRDIAHGRGLWVAVGQAIGGPGIIAVADRLAPDVWRKVFASDEFAFRSVAYGAGTFVAVSTFGIAVSRDGEHWSWVKLPPQRGNTQYFDVAFGNGRFVVAGVGWTLSSKDGQTWEQMACSDSQPCEIALQQVTFLGDRFYLFGASGGLESRDGVKLEPVAVTLPTAALGGVLVSAALEPEEAWVRAGQGDQLTEIFVSQDHGQTWKPQPITRAVTADCTNDACAVIPAGILAAREL